MLRSIKKKRRNQRKEKRFKKRKKLDFKISEIRFENLIKENLNFP